MTCRKRQDQGRPYYRAVLSWRSELDADTLAWVLLLLVLQRLEQQQDAEPTPQDGDDALDVNDGFDTAADDQSDGGAS